MLNSLKNVLLTYLICCIISIVLPFNTLPVLADGGEKFFDSSSGLNFQILAEPEGTNPGVVEVITCWSDATHVDIPEIVI